MIESHRDRRWVRTVACRPGKIKGDGLQPVRGTDDHEPAERVCAVRVTERGRGCRQRCLEHQGQNSRPGSKPATGFPVC